MKIKKLSNNGFSHIEMFIVLVVIAAVSFIGYHVYTKSTAHAGSQLLGSISTLHDGTFNITASCKTLAPSTNATTYTFTATASETNPNISYGYYGGASSFFISTQRGAKNVLTNGYTKTSPYLYSTNPDIKVNYNNPAVVIAGTADSISTPKNDWGPDGRVSTKNITIDTKLHPVIYFGTSYSNAFAKPAIRDELSWLNQSGTPVSSIPTCTSPSPPLPPVKKITPPSAPQSINVVPSPKALQVSWSRDISATSYKAVAYFNNITSTCVTQGVDNTSCSITDLKPNVNYLISVTAINSAGSSISVSVTATPLSLVNDRNVSRPYDPSQVILGVSTPFADKSGVNADVIRQNINDFSESAGISSNQPEIFNFYGCGNKKGYSFSEITDALKSINPNIIPMYSFQVPFVEVNGPNKPKTTTSYTTSTWDYCTNSTPGNVKALPFDTAVNNYIKDISRQIEAYQKPVFVRLNWEFNSTWMNHVSFLSPAEFISKWRNTVQTIHSMAPNAVMVWCPSDNGVLGYNYHTGQSTGVVNGQIPSIDDYYPGNKYVDWICTDTYPTTDIIKSKPSPDNQTQSTEYIKDELVVLNDLAKLANSHKKPMMLGEWAVQTKSCMYSYDNDPASIVNSIFNWQNSNKGIVQANLWFNVPFNPTNSPLNKITGCPSNSNDRSDLLLGDDPKASTAFKNEMINNPSRYILAN